MSETNGVDKQKNGNGVKAIWVRVIEMLIMSAIVGGVTMFGNSQVMSAKMENLCETIGDLKSSVKTLFEITATTRLDNVRQEEKINNLIDKMNEHTGSGKYRNR